MTSLVLTITVEADMPRGEVQARMTLQNLRGVHRLQRLCERFGIQPTWLLTWPVVAGPEGKRFVELADQGLAEVGTCLQPWTTPPFEAQEDRLVATGVAGRPSSSIAAKLTHLTHTFTDRFGRAPRVHRAVRAGLDGATLQALERLDYAIDTTAVPRVDATADGGTDWRDAPAVPWFPDRQRPVARGASPILEVPVSTGYHREVPDFVDRLVTHLPPMAKRVLARPGIDALRLQRLDPVAHSAAELRAFARLARGRVLVQPRLRLARGVAGERPRLEELTALVDHHQREVPQAQPDQRQGVAFARRLGAQHAVVCRPDQTSTRRAEHRRGPDGLSVRAPPVGPRRVARPDHRLPPICEARVGRPVVPHLVPPANRAAARRSLPPPATVARSANLTNLHRGSDHVNAGPRPGARFG